MINKENKRKIISILILLILDGLWITLYMGRKYNNMVYNIQGNKLSVNYGYVIGAYLMMSYLLVNVVIKYNLNLLDSFIFGFCIYGIYDFTNGAIFNKWDGKLALIDMCWGGFVYMVSNYLSNLI